MTTKTIQILGEKFEIAAPYAAGYAINDAEAKVLNQTRGENIGNNFRSRVKEALATNDEAAKAAVAQALAEFDAKYEFSMGGSSRTPVDPVERESLKIAKAAILARLKSDGRDIKSIDKDKLEDAVEKLALRDDIQRAAKKRVAEIKKTTESALEGLDL